MGLPIHNPIDSGWISRGAPIDHEGSVDFFCDACGQQTRHEKFTLLAGRYVGFGAHAIAKPFLKRAATKGKIGGVKGAIVQCVACDSLWAFDATGEVVLSMLGFPAEGVPSATHVADYERNRVLPQQQGNDEEPAEAETKARKLD